jgi:hypothetical protein
MGKKNCVVKYEEEQRDRIKRGIERAVEKFKLSRKGPEVPREVLEEFAKITSRREFDEDDVLEDFFSEPRKFRISDEYFDADPEKVGRAFAMGRVLWPDEIDEYVSKMPSREEAEKLYKSADQFAKGYATLCVASGCLAPAISPFFLLPTIVGGYYALKWSDRRDRYESIMKFYNGYEQIKKAREF